MRAAAPAPLLLVVAAALVDGGGRVLIARRPEGKPMAGLWEFPGGKVEAGEAPEMALVRELDEELGIAVRPEALSPLSFTSHRYDTFHLLMPLFVCREWEGEPEARDVADIRFVDPAALSDYPMPEADAPLRVALRTQL